MFSSDAKTLVLSCLKFATDPGALVVNGTAHGVAVERRAPAVREAGHYPAAPAVNFDKMAGDARLGDKHDFEAATARLAVIAGNFRFRLVCNVDCHRVNYLHYFT